MIQSIEDFDTELNAHTPEASANFFIIAFIPMGDVSEIRRITAFSQEPNREEMGLYLDELKADPELTPHLDTLQLQFASREEYIQFYNDVTADCQQEPQ